MAVPSSQTFFFLNLEWEGGVVKVVKRGKTFFRGFSKSHHVVLTTYISVHFSWFVYLGDDGVLVGKIFFFSGRGDWWNENDFTLHIMGDSIIVIDKYVSKDVHIIDYTQIINVRHCGKVNELDLKKNRLIWFDCFVCKENVVKLQNEHKAPGINQYVLHAMLSTVDWTFHFKSKIKFRNLKTLIFVQEPLNLKGSSRILQRFFRLNEPVLWRLEPMLW